MSASTTTATTATTATTLRRKKFKSGLSSALARQRRVDVTVSLRKRKRAEQSESRRRPYGKTGNSSDSPSSAPPPLVRADGTLVCGPDGDEDGSGNAACAMWLDALLAASHAQHPNASIDEHYERALGNHARECTRLSKEYTSEAELKCLEIELGTVCSLVTNGPSSTIPHPSIGIAAVLVRCGYATLCASLVVECSERMVRHAYASHTASDGERVSAVDHPSSAPTNGASEVDWNIRNTSLHILGNLVSDAKKVVHYLDESGYSLVECAMRAIATLPSSTDASDEVMTTAEHILLLIGNIAGHCYECRAKLIAANAIQHVVRWFTASASQSLLLTATFALSSLCRMRNGANVDEPGIEYASRAAIVPVHLVRTVVTALYTTLCVALDGVTSAPPHPSSSLHRNGSSDNGTCEITLRDSMLASDVCWALTYLAGEDAVLMYTKMCGNGNLALDSVVFHTGNICSILSRLVSVNTPLRVLEPALITLSYIAASATPAHITHMLTHAPTICTQLASLTRELGICSPTSKLNELMEASAKTRDVKPTKRSMFNIRSSIQASTMWIAASIANVQTQHGTMQALDILFESELVHMAVSLAIVSASYAVRSEISFFLSNVCTSEHADQHLEDALRANILGALIHLMDNNRDAEDLILNLITLDVLLTHATQLEQDAEVYAAARGRMGDCDMETLDTANFLRDESGSGENQSVDVEVELLTKSAFQLRGAGDAIVSCELFDASGGVGVLYSLRNDMGQYPEVYALTKSILSDHFNDDGANYDSDNSSCSPASSVSSVSSSDDDGDDDDDDDAGMSTEPVVWGSNVGPVNGKQFQF